MASGSKTPTDVERFRKSLSALQKRLRGDLSQMTSEALRHDDAGNSNLSNIPLHMADVGTENFDQEFTLGLIENEQETLDLVDAALARIDQGTFGTCTTCGGPIARPRLEAIPYTRYCIVCARKLESGESS